MLSVAQSTSRQTVKRIAQNWLENMRNVVVAQFVVMLQCLCEEAEKIMKSFSMPGLESTYPIPNKYKQSGQSVEE